MNETPARERLAAVPSIITRREVLELHTGLARIDAKLDRALAFESRLDDLESRTVELEKAEAARSAAGRSFGRVFDWVMAVGLAVISAGVWLP